MPVKKYIVSTLLITALFTFSSCGEFTAQGGVLLPLLLNEDGSSSTTTTSSTSTDTEDTGSTTDTGSSSSTTTSAGVVLSTTSGITDESGSSDIISFYLTKAPTENVTIQLTSEDTGEGTVSPSSLTFTSSDYDTLQSVTITGQDDGSIDGDIDYTITTSITTTDDYYSGVDPDDISMVNLDDDATHYFIISNISGDTDESGLSATFTVRLNTAPASDVTLPLTVSDATEGTIYPSTLTFTSTNWSIDQMVTVTGLDDAQVDGNITYTIQTGISVSSDLNFNNINPVDIKAINRDNDSAGFSIGAISGNTTEDGGSATFTVRLNTSPTASVTISLTSNDLTEGTVSPSSLTFSSANYSTPQTVTVTGVNDSIVDGDITYSVATGAASSSDSDYSGMNPSDVLVINTDNDESSTFDAATYGGHYKTITINTGSTGIPDSYSVKYAFDHADLVANTKSNASGEDVRIAYSDDGGTTWREISRVLDDSSTWNNSSTTIWFKTQAAIAAGSTDNDYRIYYRSAATAGALSSKSSVFDIYDDFTDLTRWAMWQDDGDSTAQSQSISIDGSCSGADDGSCVKINSGGPLLGGIQHKGYLMNNNTDFIVFSRSRQSNASSEMAPFIWYSGSSTEKTYAYLTSSTSNTYTLLKDSTSVDGDELAIDTDNTSGPFADATWHEFQLHHYTDGSLKIWRDSSQQFPVLGGTNRGLTSMQGSHLSGIVNMTTTSKTITLSPSVNFENAFVTCSFNSGSDPRNAPTCELTDNDADPSTAEEITITSHTTGGKVAWYLVEFASDIYVQQGTTTLPSAAGDGTDLLQTVDLGVAVDPDKSFILLTTRVNDSNTANDDRRMVLASLVDGSDGDALAGDAIQLERSESGSTTTVKWQVIEWSRASVQSGSTTITNNSFSVDVPISYTNPDTSFVVFNTSPSSTVDGAEVEYYVRGSLTSSTSIRFERNGNGNGDSSNGDGTLADDDYVDINYFVIDLGDGSNVRRGSITTDGSPTETVLTTPITNINTNLAFPILSASVGIGSAYNSDQDSGNFYADYLDSSTLRVTRNSSESAAATIDYFVTEFASWSAADTTRTTGKFSLGGKSDSGSETYSYDWVKVRKFVNPEPWITEGSETLN